MMKCFIISLVVGSLFTLGHCVFPPGTCDEYTNLTEAWRNFQFTSTTFPGFPLDDAHLVDKWWRFTGIGGDRVYAACNTGHIAGSHYNARVSFAYPTTESETATTGSAYGDVGTCGKYAITMSIVLCPGGFYIYKPSNHPHPHMTYSTYHTVCDVDSCGPLAECSSGGCVCVTGYEIPPKHLPISESYGCVDIDECERTSGICGPYSNCTNNPGSFLCICYEGYKAKAEGDVGKSNPCADIDECLENICGEGTCKNIIGDFQCTCNEGYLLSSDPKVTPLCQDIDECFNSTICGPDSKCTNTPGSFVCKCNIGYEPTVPSKEPREENICIDIDECERHVTICGPNSNCTNAIGSYFCFCNSGYRLNNPLVIASYANPCLDIDECAEEPEICGERAICTNVPGTFYCSCPDGFFPSTGILWEVGVSICENLQEILDKIKPAEGQTKERMFLDNMDGQLKNNTGVTIPEPTVANSLAASMEVSGVGPRAVRSKVSSEGDGETGSVILDISERLVSALVQPSKNLSRKSVQNPTVDLSLEVVGTEGSFEERSHLSAFDNTMEINLGDLAKNNNGTAAVGFMTLNGMESLLSHSYYQTENETQMYSNIITAVLPSVNNTNLTEPVNFTIHHKEVPSNGFLTCVYWEDNKDEAEGNTKRKMRWSVDGCWVASTNVNVTVCSCTHLSTFALIMQIGEPPPQNDFLDWLNRMCVMVGLFFFGLAIFTFLLCSWNPKINHTARLHLCLSLAMSHLLLLWNDRYTEDELACTVMAGLLHFLVVASFVWMQLEALQLYLLVRRLTKVQVIQRDGLPRPLLYLVGYGIPFVVVGISALVYSDGYGATGGVCWLSTKRNFNWALTGPVIFILAMNWLIFCATLWSLRPTLANMKSDVSQSKDTRLILFKIVAQFVILGCTWILGLYQTNLFFQVLFIILNSQQGTFLFIVHCLLNKEVRDEYVKWLTCAFNKQKREGSVKDAPSVSEDFDKPEEEAKD